MDAEEHGRIAEAVDTLRVAVQTLTACAVSSQMCAERRGDMARRIDALEQRAKDVDGRRWQVTMALIGAGLALAAQVVLALLR